MASKTANVHYGPTKFEGKTSDEMNTERRAKKAHQKSTRKGGNGTVGATIFDGVREDRRQKAEERRETVQAAKAKKVELTFMIQAVNALESEVIKGLTEGTTARVVAEAIIREFPEAVANRGKNISKMRAAVNLAMESLPKEHAARKGAVSLGRNKAAQALNAAYKAADAQAGDLVYVDFGVRV